jgi:hypothetical protein
MNGVIHESHSLDGPILAGASEYLVHALVFPTRRIFSDVPDEDTERGDFSRHLQPGLTLAEFSSSYDGLGGVPICIVDSGIRPWS